MPLTYNLAQIEEAAQYILKHSKSKIILFYGDMGAGKTTLITSLVKALGSEDKVSSPTFSLVNEYSSPTNSIFHFDFYRIDDENEALDIGLEEYLNEDAFIFIEWPQKIGGFLEENFQKVDIITKDKNLRMLMLS
ncbi:tRNA threonylcarbamoyladenosine biosynthesis protein TsaE [Salegentibacter echinorum]|uniref:tRNA threonylcarbamoyladenosine biosynthesis protein TsaE n=1 Tax=Salegentibacter echinorum TaxID=1073325 RepID=A0A1M5IXW2_SALEC|nr:tRNA (adenosine(37)-N6)-threonylcarbamoyltransferase complex ATPase subunit type 1 TsaE [Salegentibacter echinorum]SHG32889.1 tRNA threonylcarbamoyladenosine biosynthesis protein TsaE [Salegentibacter echinorum]